ncbi:winged helix-turn-helix domain-containing protein [Providencia sp. Me31A]|uniref:winged helix-turn-helix domain-containing protein n=1 Tax=Providencia sp. Me31A TaxID=3392637 RepID=UPI003D2CB084
MSHFDDNEIAPTILLSEKVVYDPLKRTLSRGKLSTSLTENESCLLKILLTKTSNKREIMYEIWEKRGTIVTESSYYKLVRQLRQSFKKVELDENLIMTLPRIGILYTGEKSEMPILSKYNPRNTLYSYVKCFLQKVFARSL